MELAKHDAIYIPRDSSVGVTTETKKCRGQSPPSPPDSQSMQFPNGNVEAAAEVDFPEGTLLAWHSSNLTWVAIMLD